MPPQIATVAQVLFELKIMRNSKCKKNKEKKKALNSSCSFTRKGKMTLNHRRLLSTQRQRGIYITKLTKTTLKFY